MTVQKALKILDWWIAQREHVIKEIIADSKDFETMAIIRDSEKTIISNLKLIKNELVPKCEHPKKMQDTCAGVKYCMECNCDLWSILYPSNFFKN